MGMHRNLLKNKSINKNPNPEALAGEVTLQLHDTPVFFPEVLLTDVT